jgi:hypothetical protein
MHDKQMVNGSRFLSLFLVGAVLLVLATCFYKYFFQKDFFLYIKEVCNPEQENCFVHECDEDDSRCSGLAGGSFHYKIVYAKAYLFDDCFGDGCTQSICEQNKDLCSIYMCSDEILSEFELSDTCNKQST